MEILLNKLYLINNGSYKGYNLIVKEYSDDDKIIGYEILMNNIITNEKYEDFFYNFDKVIEFCKDFNMSLIVSKDRALENEIIDWWIKNFPQCKEKILREVSLFEADKEIGIYNILGYGLLQENYDKSITNNNKEKLKQFLLFYEKFYSEFHDKVKDKKYLDEFTGIEMFEWLNKEQLDIVYKMLENERLKKMCKDYYKYL